MCDSVNSIHKKSCADPEDDRVLDPAEKSQNIEFSSNAGPDPLKNHKTTNPAFNVKPMMAPLSPHQPKKLDPLLQTFLE